MIQDNYMLLFCLAFLVFFFIMHQYYEIIKTKKTTLMQLEIIRNEITKEKKLLDHYDKEVVKIVELEKNTNQKLMIIKTKIVTLDFSFKELIECLTRS